MQFKNTHSEILLRDQQLLLNNQKIPHKTPNKNGTVIIADA